MILVFRKYFKVVFINIIVLMLLLLLLEGVLRIINFGPGTQPMDLDPVLHHVHPKNYTFSPYDPLYNEYGGHLVQYDNFGRRVKEKLVSKNAAKEAWFLGDSFTEAMQISYDSTFVGRIQDYLGDTINCINFGNASYSPLIHTIILQKALKLKTPEVVYIQVYSNDIYDDDKYTKLATFENGLPVKCFGGHPNSLISIIRKSYLARNFRQLYWKIKYLNFERGKELSFRHHVEHSPNLDSNSHFVKNIISIDSILNSHSVPHYFFAIPSKYACYTGDWESNSFDKEFNNFSSNRNLPFVNVRSYFEGIAEPSGIFFYRDVHLTARGNKVLATSLLDHLVQQ